MKRRTKSFTVWLTTRRRITRRNLGLRTDYKIHGFGRGSDDPVQLLSLSQMINLRYCMRRSYYAKEQYLLGYGPPEPTRQTHGFALPSQHNEYDAEINQKTSLQEVLFTTDSGLAEPRPGMMPLVSVSSRDRWTFMPNQSMVLWNPNWLMICYILHLGFISRV
jgi:hypothetical protein